MNEKKPLFVFLAIVTGSVLIVGSMWVFFFMREIRKVQLPVYGIVPDFKLTDQEGRTVRMGDLLGKVWIADFIFTNCAGTCPLMTGRMKEVQNLLATDAGIQLVSISVDPKTDTPQKLKQYAQMFGAKNDQWLFLTGEYNEVQRLAKNGFFLSMEPGNDPKEPIIHSQKFILVDDRGRIRGYYDGESPAITSTMLKALETLQRSK